MHHFLHENLKNKIEKPALKSELSHLANSCLDNYKLSRPTLREHGILKKLRNDRTIAGFTTTKRKWCC